MFRAMMVMGMVVSAVVTVVMRMVVTMVVTMVIIAIGPVRMFMAVTFRMAVMIVVAGFAMRVIVGADSGFLIPIDKIESCEEDKSNSREEGIDAEIRVEVFFDPAAGVIIEKEDAPGHQGDDREEIEKLFHGRYSDGGGIRGESRGS
jgi:hypothetical protein